VIWLLAIFFAGTGLFIYLILWLVLPLAPTTIPVTVPGSPAQV